MLRLNDFITQAGSVRDEDLQFCFTLFLVFVQQGLVSVQAGFPLGMSGLGSHIDPLQFTL